MSHVVEITIHIENINLNFFQPIKSRFYSLRKSTLFIFFRKQEVYFRWSLDLPQTYHSLNFFEQIIQHYWSVNKNLSCLLLIVNFSIIIFYMLSTVPKIFPTYYLYVAYKITVRRWDTSYLSNITWKETKMQKGQMIFIKSNIR